MCADSFTKDECKAENLHVRAEGCQLSIIIGGQKGNLCETSLPWHLFWYRSRLSPRQWPNRPNRPDRPNALLLIGRNRRRNYSSTTGRWYRSTRRMGNGSKRPLLSLAHTDVVAVQKEKWPVDPFGAVMKDGYIWGRGTIDDKDKLVSMLMSFILMKRSGAVLDRDLIFLAESGEEADPTGVGINFMVNQHFDEINAEFAITEGGTAKLENGRVTVVQVGTTEKVPRRARLVATGSSGHGSVPRID